MSASAIAAMLPTERGTAVASSSAALDAVRSTAAGPLVGVNRGAEVLAITKRAHADLGLKQEAAAAQAGVKPSQYSTALSGTGNFGLTWLYAQDDAFLLRWIELVMEYRGLTPDNKRAIRACRIVELVRLLTED